MIRQILTTGIIPENEMHRLENLKKYRILYTRSEPIFDQLAALTATLMNVPIAMINFVDKDIAGKIVKVVSRETKFSDDQSLCSVAILKDGVTIFEDAIQDPCLLSNPLVAAEYGLRFYAAAPIVTDEDFRIGSLCIVDRKPRKFTADKKKKLKWLAAIVKSEIEKRTGDGSFLYSEVKKRIIA